jgi:hypothetical protein
VIEFCDKHSGFVLAVLTTLYVVATVVLVGLTYRQFRFVVGLERDRIRPSVNVDIVYEFLFFHIAVTNFGKTEARNIKIEIQPQIRVLLAAFDEPKPIPFLQDGIMILSPGREIKGTIGSWKAFTSEYPDKKFTGEVSYEDAHGQTYRTPISIDVSYEEGLAHLQRLEVHDLAKTLREIRQDLNDLLAAHRTLPVRIVEPD